MKMTATIPLTETQRAILRSAIEGVDGVCHFPDRINRPAAQKSAARLIEKELVREIKAKAGAPTWRRDDSGRSFTLIITKQGRTMVGMATDVKEQLPRVIAATAGAAGKLIELPKAPRHGSKIAKVIILVSRESGASLPELIAQTGWLPHTTRAALTGLRKRGYSVESEKQTQRGTVYRLSNLSRGVAP